MQWLILQASSCSNLYIDGARYHTFALRLNNRCVQRANRSSFTHLTIDSLDVSRVHGRNASFYIIHVITGALYEEEDKEMAVMSLS